MRRIPSFLWGQEVLQSIGVSEVFPQATQKEVRQRDVSTDAACNIS